eukprot:452123-Prymnesium_polylepis.2
MEQHVPSQRPPCCSHLHPDPRSRARGESCDGRIVPAPPRATPHAVTLPLHETAHLSASRSALLRMRDARRCSAERRSELSARHACQQQK